MSAGTDIKVEPRRITITITSEDDAWGLAMLGPANDGFSRDMVAAALEAWPKSNPSGTWEEIA